MKVRSFVWISLFSMLALLGCSGSIGLNIFPDSKDIELGKQIDGEIRKDPKTYPLLTDAPQVQQYIESIGLKILNSPAVKKRSIYAYKFAVVRDDSTINAFCTPGGYVYIYTGLMKFLDNEASLAGVIGHEIAHAERRHATKRMTSQMGLELIVSVALGQNASQTAKLGANLFAGLGLLANSRADESEADEYSMLYLGSTEYYPGAIRYFFEKISTGRKAKNLERFLSTHPVAEDRQSNVDKFMNEHYPAMKPGEANLFADRYRAIRSSLP